MSVSTTPDTRHFKIRDAFAILGCLVMGAVAIMWGGTVGLYSLSPFAAMLLGASGQTATILVILWLARRRGMRFREWVMGDRRWQREVGLGVLGAAALWAIGIGLWLAGLVPISDRLSLTILDTPLPVRLVFFIMAVGLAPVAEELLYRGVLQGSFAARFNIYLACVVQAAIFALMHQKQLVVMLMIFVGGIAMGMIVHWRKSLVASMSTHAGLNTVGAGWLVLLYWLNAHEPAMTMREAQNPPNWLSASAVTTVADRPSASEQFEFAVQRFGSQGLQLWKWEIQGLEAVRRRFPDDRHHGALSLAALQEVYLLYLHDPRRAIVAGQQLIKDYPQQRELCARASLFNARAYRMVGDKSLAGHWLAKLQDEYGDIHHLRDQALRLERDLAIPGRSQDEVGL